MEKLKDICTINPKAPVLVDDLKVSFVPMPKVGEQGEFDPSEIKEYREVKKGFTNFQNGDVLFAKITPCMENGKGAVAQDLKNGYGFGSTEFHILRPDYSKVTSEWLYYLTSWGEFRKEAESNMTGSAGQKRVPKTFLENYDVNLPELQKQKEMAEILDRIGVLIALRKEQLAKLDQLVKSRFIELFGNVLCDNDLPLVQLKELADIGSSKRIYANEYVESGIPFYRSKEIRELGTGLKPSVELFIKQERYDEIKVKYGVPKIGDILIAAIGATIGYSWIVDTDKPFYYKDGNLIILSTKNNVNPIFLNHTMGILIEEFKSKGVAGSAQLALTIEKLEKMMVVNPSIDLQNQFAAFVEQTDKSKLAIQQSLDKLELLKKSLMQEYFG